MIPAQLKLENFAGYQPEARKVAEQHLALLRTLPLSFLPLLLREVIGYDRKFPAERRELDHQLSYLAGLPENARAKELAAFREIHIDQELQQQNWVSEPARFSEALSAHLWGTHQIDEFHTAAVAYMDRANASLPALPPKRPRLAVIMIGQGVQEAAFPLFRKLRPHGTYFTNIDPENGASTISSWLSKRAAQTPDRYSHWSITGASPDVQQPGLTSISYQALAPARAKLGELLRRSFESGVGSEALRTRLAALQPAEIGFDPSRDPAATWFQLSLLSEGSGTQIFSTSFVQWAAREALRRAQPLTMVCRYTPRVKSSSTKDLLSPDTARTPELDAAGSLVDADMAAYQTWINLQRLAGGREATFVCWFEGQRQMLVIAPAMKPGTINNRLTTFRELEAELQPA